MERPRIPYVVLPAFVFLIIFMFMPLAYVISLSFDQGIRGFSAFLIDPLNQTILLRTLKIAVLTTMICIVLGLPAAYFVAKLQPRYRRILLAISMFPLLTNAVVRSFAWITILGNNGVLNKLLLALHMTQQPLSMLYTEFAIVVGMVYLFLPLMLVTLVGVLEQIHVDLVEAATSLGCSSIKAFCKIILPLSLPGIIVGSILVFTGTLSAYTTPQLLGGNKNMVLATLIYQKAMTLGDWSSASIIAVITVVITFAVIKSLHAVEKKLDKRV